MIERLKLTSFVRTKETVNKEAILKDSERAADVAGISITSGVELFFVEPFETEIEKASVIK